MRNWTEKMNGKTLMIALPLFTLVMNSQAEGSNNGSYTLYRNSVLEEMRIHIATFDTTEGEAYNHENCDIAAGLFEAQPGVTVRYWCEKGEYRK